MKETNFLQNLRLKLQERVRAAGALDSRDYHTRLVHLYQFIEKEDALKSLVINLELARPETVVAFNEHIADRLETPDLFDEDASACWCWKYVEFCAKSSDSFEEARTGTILGRDGHRDHAIRWFHSNLVEPLYRYLDEHLDDERVILALLLRFRKKTEWFHKERAYNNLMEDSRKGEKTVALMLYEFLFDQGLDFHIEPSTSIGRPDAVSDYIRGEEFVLDVKLMREAGDKSYLIKGFNQVYQYALERQVNFAYLVVFRACESDLAVHSGKFEMGASVIIHNNVSMFAIIIDIFAPAPTASKRGALQTVSITEAEIVTKIEEPGQ